MLCRKLRRPWLVVASIVNNVVQGTSVGPLRALAASFPAARWWLLLLAVAGTTAAENVPPL